MFVSLAVGFSEYNRSTESIEGNSNSGDVSVCV